MRNRRETRAALGVFTVLLGTYLATSSFRTDTIDTGIRLEVARGLVATGSPALDAIQLRTPFGVIGSFPGRDGRHYSVYGLGQSLLLVPAVLFGGERAEQLATLLNPIVTAAACALLVVWGGALGFSARAAIAFALAVGLGTLVWPQSKLTFEAPIEMLAAVGAFSLAGRHDRRAAVVAGGVLGLAIVVRPSAILLAPGLLVFLDRKHWTALAAGAAPGVAVALAYNAYRWGSPFASGYAHTSFRYFQLSWEGLVGLTVSPGRGFFWYSPVLLLALAGMRPLHERHPRLARALLATCVTYVAFFACTTIWNGDWTWGPRHLLPLVPLVGLGLLPLFESGVRRSVLVPLLAISVAVQLVGTSVSYETYYLWHNDQLRRSGRIERAGRYHFDPATSQIRVQAGQAVHFLARWRAYSASYRPAIDGNPYAPILRGSAPVTKRVPDYWWVYLPLTGAPAALPFAIGFGCLALVGGGALLLRRGQPAS